MVEHTVVLGASAFLQEISPTLPRNKKTTKNGTASIEDVDDEQDAEGGEDEEDEVYEADWEALDELADDMEVDLPVEFEAGDVLGKALGFINQVYFSLVYHGINLIVFEIRSSPQARAFFESVCILEELPPLELKKWIRTRWGSMYDLLDRLIANRSVCL